MIAGVAQPRRYWQLHDADWLRHEYVELGRTLTDIARDVGCTRQAVGLAVQAFGLREWRVPDPIAQLRDVDWLRARYVEDRLTIAQIATVVGCTAPPVREALIRAGIERRRGSGGRPVR